MYYSPKTGAEASSASHFHYTCASDPRSITSVMLLWKLSLLRRVSSAIRNPLQQTQGLVTRENINKESPRALLPVDFTTTHLGRAVCITAGVLTKKECHITELTRLQSHVRLENYVIQWESNNWIKQAHTLCIAVMCLCLEWQNEMKKWNEKNQVNRVEL